MAKSRPNSILLAPQTMRMALNRRRFMQALVAGGIGLSLPRLAAGAAAADAFSFVLLGDLHFDRLTHHNLDWLQKEKPDDFRQVQNYSRLTAEIQPKLFATVRDTIAERNQLPETRVAFVAQVGDFLEGLCGREELALRQASEAIEFVRDAKLGVPFLFTKGNHDITGPGASEAFKTIFQPFLGNQSAGFGGGGKPTRANFAIEHAGALFCFFDAYDQEGLAWLEATLAKRTARHCFVILHPPVVPYGARSTWHLYSAKRDQAQRERMLDLLGKHNAFVLSGHIHKYSLLVRATPRGGRFLQLAVSSVINALEVKPGNALSGVQDYTGNQVRVEPDFSPGTEPERRAVYDTERPFVRQYDYADLPGYANITLNGAAVSMQMFSGLSRSVWRTVELSKLLGA